MINDKIMNRMKDMIHSASAYPRLQARVKRTIAYTPDGTAGFPTVVDFDQGVDDYDGKN